MSPPYEFTQNETQLVEDMKILFNLFDPVDHPVQEQYLKSPDEFIADLLEDKKQKETRDREISDKIASIEKEQRERTEALIKQQEEERIALFAQLEERRKEREAEAEKTGISSHQKDSDTSKSVSLLTRKIQHRYEEFSKFQTPEQDEFDEEDDEDEIVIKFPTEYESELFWKINEIRGLKFTRKNTGVFYEDIINHWTQKYPHHQFPEMELCFL